MKKKILILTHSPLNSGPRPLRQIKLFKGKYEIHTVGTTPSGEEDVFYKFEKANCVLKVMKVFLLKISLYNLFYWDSQKRKLVKLLKPNNYDLIIAHDEDTLPIALKIKNSNTKIILDAHELLPYEATHIFMWRFFYQKYINWICGTYIPQVDAFFTVSENISRKYFEMYGVKSIVVTNAGNYAEIEPSKVTKPIKLVHHGGCFSDRKIELLIQMMDFLDNKYELNLILSQSQSDEKYFQKIKKMAEIRNNIVLMDYVNYFELIPTLNLFDIGVYILPPTNLNTDFALPNKFFEFIQAKLAIAIGPSTEMAEIVNLYDLGIVSKDFNPESLAKKIKELTSEKIDYYKSKSKEFAKELSSEPNKMIIKKVVSELLNQKN